MNHFQDYWIIIAYFLLVLVLIGWGITKKTYAVKVYINGQWNAWVSGFDTLDEAYKWAMNQVDHPEDFKIKTIYKLNWKKK